MKPEIRSVLSTLAKGLCGLVAFGVVILIVTAIGFAWLFRSHEEAPVDATVALQRLEAHWPNPAFRTMGSAKVLSYRKETTWDGTTHEDWTVFVSESLKPDAKGSPFLRIENPSSAWPLPEAAIAAGYRAAPAVVYLGGGGGSIQDPSRVVGDHAVLWPLVPHGWIVSYQVSMLR